MSPRWTAASQHASQSCDPRGFGLPHFTHERRMNRVRKSRKVLIGLVLRPMCSIAAFRLAEVMPGAVAKREPHAPTSEPSHVLAGRIRARSPMEGSASAERQAKLVITERQLTVPTHVLAPRRFHDLFLEPPPAPIGDHSDREGGR